VSDISDWLARIKQHPEVMTLPHMILSIRKHVKPAVLKNIIIT